MNPSDRLRDWWMFGAGRLWVARALNVAGVVNFAFFIWMFLSSSLYWLLFFFMALTAFSVASIIKRKSAPAPAAPATPKREDAGTTSGAARALWAASPLPPAPMFDREGRTPLERVMRDDEEEK